MYINMSEQTTPEQQHEGVDHTVALAFTDPRVAHEGFMAHQLLFDIFALRNRGESSGALMLLAESDTPTLVCLFTARTAPTKMAGWEMLVQALGTMHDVFNELQLGRIDVQAATIVLGNDPEWVTSDDYVIEAQNAARALREAQAADLDSEDFSS